MDEAMTTNRKQCQGTRKDGSGCTAFALPSSDFCFAHDPGRAQERSEARAKGGRNRANVVRLRGIVPPRLIPVFDQLERALIEVHVGSLPASHATAMASVARAMVAVLTAGELEERVRNLEEGTQGGTQTWRDSRAG